MIALNDARRHLRIDGMQDDEEIAQKLATAKAIVDSYIDPALTRQTVTLPASPTPEQQRAFDLQTRTDLTLDAATLLVLGELWANRESGAADPLSPAAKNLLRQFRPLVYA